MAQATPDDLGWLTAVQVFEEVRSGRLDRQAVLKAHLERIRRLDVKVHAYTHVDERAQAGAGALTGSTLAVKDTQPVAGMPWTYGSPVWRERGGARGPAPTGASPALRICRSESIRPSAPWSYAWLFARLPTSTPASCMAGSADGVPWKLNSFTSWDPRLVTGHSTFTMVRSSRRKSPPNPDHA